MEWLLLVMMLNGVVAYEPITFTYTDEKTCELALKKIEKSGGAGTCIPQGKTKQDPIDKMLNMIDRMHQEQQEIIKSDKILPKDLQ